MTRRAWGFLAQKITDEALDFLADMAEGDARSALNAVELGILTTEPGEDGEIVIDINVAQECIQKRVMRYDKGGDNHYDIIRHLLRALRGSDPDAAVYYLARMIDAGESILHFTENHDLRFGRCRKRRSPGSAGRSRGIPGCGEDRTSGSQDHSCPGGDLCGGSTQEQCGLYGCGSGSGSTMRKRKNGMVPNHLRDSHYKGASKLGRGIGYQYAHNFPGHYVKQQYLPDELLGAMFL